MENKYNVNENVDIIFRPVTAVEFLHKAIIDQESIVDIRELGFYIIVNDTFLPIDECSVTPGTVTLHNNQFDYGYNVEMEETGMIFQMVNINEVWKEVDN